MNERIKELALNAGFAHEPKKYQLWAGDGPTEIMISPGLGKFAELIVKECAVVAHNTAEGETTYGWMVGNKIKEHFGVEE
jgi:hypothetical protein